ncbi:hypothetical protein KTJ90_11160 [Pantoea jilinensis]|nr:hypothetical protein KTJ90_11160 [Pantoea jilinensis]
MSKESTTKETIVWWEKTVEYKFVADCLEKKIIESIAPLSGFQEQAGDIITVIRDAYKNFKFYIIEFKKDLGDDGFNREVKKKFKGEIDGYNAAKSCFTDEKNNPIVTGHYFIGAKYENDFFQLVVRDYFAHDRSQSTTLEEALSSKAGMTDDQFALYVGRFASHKKTQKCHHCSDSDEGGHNNPNMDNPDPGGKAITAHDLSVVVAINPDNKKCITFPLHLVHLTDGMGGTPEISISPDFGGGGRDGVSVNHEVFFKHIRYEDNEKGQLSHPDGMKEEILC